MDKATNTKLALAANYAVAALGLYLMVASHLLGYGRPAEALERVVGPVVTSFAVVATWQATRGLRFVNLLCGAALVLGPLILMALAPYPLRAAVNDVAVGLAIIGLTLVPYPQTKSFGGGWKRLVRSP